MTAMLFGYSRLSSMGDTLGSQGQEDLDGPLCTPDDIINRYAERVKRIREMFHKVELYGQARVSPVFSA